jgi:hypothetical protein
LALVWRNAHTAKAVRSPDAHHLALGHVGDMLGTDGLTEATENGLFPARFRCPRKESNLEPSD